MNKPLVNEINFFQDQQQIPNQSTSVKQGPGANGKTMNLPIVEGPIDNNLIEALQKHHERAITLRIEQSIFNFVHSK